MTSCGGYAFCWVRQASEMEAPDRMHRSGPPIILVKEPEADVWRVLRAQPTEDPSLVAVSGMDHSLWQAIGGGGASLTLPDGVRERVLAQLLAAPLVGQRIQRPGGKAATVQTVRPQGGVRIQPEHGEERAVSLTDICWVAVAQAQGGMLDEATVNRWRYLPGTPKASTRWIDTGWAIGIWEAVNR